MLTKTADSWGVVVLFDLRLTVFCIPNPNLVSLFEPIDWLVGCWRFPKIYFFSFLYLCLRGVLHIKKRTMRHGATSFQVVGKCSVDNLFLRSISPWHTVLGFRLFQVRFSGPSDGKACQTDSRQYNTAKEPHSTGWICFWHITSARSDQPWENANNQSTGSKSETRLGFGIQKTVNLRSNSSTTRQLSAVLVSMLQISLETHYE